MVFVILGMHKSGTTLIAEILHKSGIEMVENWENSKDYDKGEKYERKATNLLNKEILNCQNLNSISNKINKVEAIDEKEKETMQSIIQSCESKGLNWGFKDPRTCLTYTIWEKYLPKHKLIIVFRHPEQVIKHYTSKVKIKNKWKTFKAALKTYKIYNEILLDIVEHYDKNNFILIEYGELMKNNLVMDSLSKFTETTLHDARKTNKYRKKNQGSFLIDLYEFFNTQTAMDQYRKLEYHYHKQCNDNLEIIAK